MNRPYEVQRFVLKWSTRLGQPLEREHHWVELEAWRRFGTVLGTIDVAGGGAAELKRLTRTEAGQSWSEGDEQWTPFEWTEEVLASVNVHRCGVRTCGEWCVGTRGFRGLVAGRKHHVYLCDDHWDYMVRRIDEERWSERPGAGWMLCCRKTDDSGLQQDTYSTELEAWKAAANALTEVCDDGCAALYPPLPAPIIEGEPDFSGPGAVWHTGGPVCFYCFSGFCHEFVVFTVAGERPLCCDHWYWMSGELPEEVG